MKMEGEEAHTTCFDIYIYIYIYVYVCVLCMVGGHILRPSVHPSIFMCSSRVYLSGVVDVLQVAPLCEILQREILFKKKKKKKKKKTI
jgi:hypothetical protein